MEELNFEKFSSSWKEVLILKRPQVHPPLLQKFNRGLAIRIWSSEFTTFFLVSRSWITDSQTLATDSPRKNNIMTDISECAASFFLINLYEEPLRK